MQIVYIEDIQIGDRVRVPTDEDVKALALDIKEKGLFHAIVLTTHANKSLVAGETRIRAIQLIGEWAQELGIEGAFRHNDELISCDCIPYVIVGDLTPRQMLEYEIAENLIRADIPWQDRTRALAKLHADLGSAAAPATVTRTAAELMSVGDKRNTTTIQNEVSKALIIADHLDNPDVAKAKTPSEAWTVIRNQSMQLQRTLLSASIEADKESVTSHRLIHGDMAVEMAKMEAEQFDLIIADLPYGSNADQWTSKFVDTPHDYKDDIATAEKLHFALFHHGLKVCREHANMFVFCDPKHWHRWAEMAEKKGWGVWPRPVIWKKSMEGIRPHGTAGFAYTYEAILYCTKGRKGLLKSVNDVIDIYKIVSGRLHGAQKPEELYSYLMDISSLPGDTVLDPTCGSGTIFPAASNSKLVATGIEVNPEYYTIAESRRQETACPAQPDTMNELAELL